MLPFLFLFYGLTVNSDSYVAFYYTTIIIMLVSVFKVKKEIW